MRREMRPHIISVVAIVTYLAHFWIQPPAGIALWAVSATFAIASIHFGMMARGQSTDKTKRWMPDSAVIIGCIILLGVTLSAIFLLAPRMAQTG
jgi:hypothetical protein